MRISVIGLGYVGCVSAACMAGSGHQVVGVDINNIKISAIQNGKCPIIEPELPELIAEAVEKGNLTATSDIREAVLNTEISLICIGTPSRPNGSLNLSFVEKVSGEIGKVLKDKKENHTVVVRSTVLPGTTENIVIPILEESSGGNNGEDFSVIFNPEFLREGKAIYDFYHPPRTVIGTLDKDSGKVVEDLFRGVEGPVVYTDLITAEMVKYSDNCFHALKVAFGNEIGRICKIKGVDSRELMKIFCMDKKLNISPVYLMPGNAFGGSCLPKDLRAITYMANKNDVSIPVLDSIIDSNESHKKSALDLVVSQKKKKIGIAGLSFKENTDDLRESPAVELAERLIGKGFDVRIYDNNMILANLLGSNQAFIEGKLPHIASLMVSDIDRFIEESEVIVFTNHDDYDNLANNLRDEQVIIDLANTLSGKIKHQENYNAIVG